jgi:long-chain acyl-CoA synthetase
MTIVSLPRISGATEPMAALVGTVGRDPRTAAGRTLPALLRDRVHEDPGAVSMRRKRHGVWRSWSRRDVYARVRGLAAGLAGLGLRRGDVLAMISENIVELYWLEYAALSLGARVVCMYPDVTAGEMLYVLTHSKARLLVAEDQEQVDKALAVVASAPELGRVVYIDPRGLWHYAQDRLLDFETLLRDGMAADAADPARFDAALDAIRQEDVAVLCYTSGTTGKPKAAMLTHRYLLDNAYRVMAGFGVPANAAYLSYISPAWAAEQITGLALALLAPMVVNFAEKPETVQANLRELGPQVLLFTPRQWEMMASAVQAHMLDAGRLRRALYDWAVRVRLRSVAAGKRASVLGRLADILIAAGIRDNLGLKRAVVALSGGSGLSAEIFSLFHAYGVRLRNLYGSTELGLVAGHVGDRFDPDTMGALLPTDPSIGDPSALAVDPSGELIVTRGCHFAGYLGDDAAGRAMRTAEGGYRTGDAVRINDAGELIFLDRVKDMRRLAVGAAVPLQFIENRLRASPFIKDAMVLADERRTFAAALINIDAEIAGRFAESRGLAFGTFAELSQLPAVREEIGRAIAAVNTVLDDGCRLQRFATLPKELDPDEAELTRSRKLRREKIEESYADIVAAIYGGVAECRARIPVRYRDGSEAVIAVGVAINRMDG